MSARACWVLWTVAMCCAWINIGLTVINIGLQNWGLATFTLTVGISAFALAVGWQRRALDHKDPS